MRQGEGEVHLIDQDAIGQVYVIGYRGEVADREVRSAGGRCLDFIGGGLRGDADDAVRLGHADRGENVDAAVA
ncbi:MAG: hypothetical protein M3453_03445, partial [Pseudomonadota bacterium]|nr:hypothetical protein [Pseudomonadota bacterium]